MAAKQAKYNGIYRGEQLNHVAFPLGGLGAGMFCLEGVGTFSHVSLRNKPDVLSESRMFAALCVKGKENVARVLEGPVPTWRIFSRAAAGNGHVGGPHFGLPRCETAAFKARFPFGTVSLSDPNLPLKVEITGWSPFIPGDADNSSLPVAGVEYKFTNAGAAAVDAVFSFHALNFMALPPEKDKPRTDSVQRAAQGFILNQDTIADKPWAKGAFCVETEAPGATVDCAMFRGGWFDPVTMAWKHVSLGECVENPPLTEGNPSPGGSLYVPFTVPSKKSVTVRVRLSWYVPESDIRVGKDPEPKPACTDSACSCNGTEKPPCYRPWYAGRFGTISEVAAFWREQYARLRDRTAEFTACFYDTSLPPEVVDAVAANLAILKSPTVLRQPDGRLWGWEGCGDSGGCCHGSCTHVWNYAQAIPHLFPALERTLRETEFMLSQNDKGHQTFRSYIPLRPAFDHDFHAAADGQLGGIIKVYREWRISGDTAWMKSLWPQVRQSLDYCIGIWDPDHVGALVEPHHNTYDIEFWGPDGMCTSFYLGALQAAILMGREAGADISLYETLLDKGRKFMETELWNGEYFNQKIQWIGLRASDPTKALAMNSSYSTEAAVLLQKEGPKYQYGNGCLSDGVLGAWLAAVSGIDDVLAPAKVASHLSAIHRYNLKHDLSEHSNPQRPGYALGHEGGLLLCSWPHGDKLSLPFVYSDEVWTGIEYQVASHLLLAGLVDAALEIVRLCRDRYDGTVRNPFNEYECGHWYARAMSSYGLLQGMTGARYDAVEKTLYLKPQVAGDFKAFFSTATGFGTVGVKDGQPFLKVKSGRIDLQQIICG